LIPDIGIVNLALPSIKAVVPSEARALLTRFDERSHHYEVLAKRNG
jgi:hypothetical protein